MTISLNLLYIIYLQLPHFDEYASLKLGIVFFSLHFITFKLLSTTKRNLLLNQIDELINDITFDNKSVADGEETLKLIIYGFQFNTIVSPLINEHLELAKTNKDICDLVIERLNQIKDEKETKQRRLLIDAIVKQISDIKRINLLISKSRNRILNKLSFFHLSEKSNPDYNTIQALLDKLQKERDDKLTELEKTADSIISILDNFNPPSMLV